jgi:regulator of protease activity HflC (stomatin/prohibitin superfamily)
MDTLATSLCLSGAFLVLMMVFAASAIRIVPEYQRLVVFRLGRFVGERGPGIVLLFPNLDRAFPVDLRPQKQVFGEQTFETRDHIQVPVQVAWQYQVISPSDSILKVEKYETAMQARVATVLRQEIERGYARDLAHVSEAWRQEFSTRLGEAFQEWGIRLNQVDLQFGEIALPHEAIVSTPKTAGRSSSPLVGMSGETVSTIHMDGTIVLGEDTWPAISKRPIPPGRRVRVSRVVLEVEEM